MKAFEPKLLPLTETDLNYSVFMESLIDAVSKMEVYRTKLDSSKLSINWFLPTLQQKEAVASTLLEGTQVTLNGVLEDCINPNDKDKNLCEVRNYYLAAHEGYSHLKANPLSKELIQSLHKTLLSGNVRKNKTTIPGEFRTDQNYVGQGKRISYIPPVPELVDNLIDNFIEYFNDIEDKTRPLVRAAIMHAQFETIHPFQDGNGRVGRILIPLFLYKHNQISLPYFFISEALERNKFKYYDLLNGIREKNDWNSWIDYFLRTVTEQCEKYISMVDKINDLYERDLEIARSIIKNNKVVDLINLLYTHPIINSNIVAEYTDLTSATITRYLNELAEHKIIYCNDKKRHRVYYYYNLLEILN